MQINRRRFLESSAVAAALATTANHANADHHLIPIVDTHQHLWDFKKYRSPWLASAPDVLNQPYGTAEYLKAVKGMNVAKAVYMEVDVDLKDQVTEANYITELSKSVDHPTVAAVISGRPNSDQFEKYITQFKDNKYIKGVRQVLQVDSAPRGLCLEKQFVKSMHLLGEMGRSFDLCMRPTELADGAALAKQCPDTRFIVDHCGNGDPGAFMKNPEKKPWHEAEPWKRDIAWLAKQENVVCKISGIIARAPKGWKSDHLAPLINHCLDEFGPDRVIFGSDWPVCLLGAPLAEWIGALKEVISERPKADQVKLLGGNAIRLYGLG